MKNLVWRQLGVVIAILITIVVLMLPYRGVLVSHKILSEELKGFVSPSKMIVEEIIVEAKSDRSHSISQYDDLFQKVAIPRNIHWCLVSAMCYVESRFKPDARSYSGAIGLMQIMPRVGRSLGVEPEELYNPEVNVRIAIQHLCDIERMLSLPRGIDHRDRLSLILAGYNGGVGRVFDAQRLTRLNGGDPHKWSDVAPSMLKLRKEKWYNHELVKFGEYRMAHYTIYYVRNVLRKYDEYLTLTNYSAHHLYPYARLYDI